MNLQDISDIYQKNLMDFFKNEKIIEYIYKEQYGEENYNNNKGKYHEEYKKIIENTIFIPYITLEHLENFINSVKNQYGELFVQKNFADESSLLRNLTIKKQKIIKDYTSELVNELRKIVPRTEKSKLNNILPKCSNSNFDDNVKIIKDTLSENKKSLFQNFKNRQINKLIEKYNKDIKEKVLIETSSYFKHKSEVPNNKYYTSIINDMLKNGQFVSQQIGKDSDRNYRYIYLPVLKYKTEKEYLKHAVHEVMHISKEKVSKNKYRSGLLERELPSNKSGNLLIKDKPFDSLLQSLKWTKFKKDIKLPKAKGMYHSYLGNINIEEVIHHWQVRNVVDNIINSELINLIHMPYKNQSTKIEYSNYECADKTTEKFMASFSDDIQKVNNGEMSIKKFKNTVGNSNFELLGKLYTNWTTGISVKARQISPSKQSGGTNIQFSFGPEQEAYSYLGDKIVKKMVSNAEKVKNSKSKRAEILEKTTDVLSTDICDIGKSLTELLTKTKNKSKTKKNSVDDIEI